ncbi:hypothetical protein WG66_010922, partial [Moniliophthora roreri]
MYFTVLEHIQWYIK